jgi:integrase
MRKMSKSPTSANRVLSVVRKMFNMAEVWGMRPEGSNPCRHVPKFPERGKTKFINDVELRRLYAYLDKAEAEGLEHPFILLAVRLQFEFAARMSEILKLEWGWVDLNNRRVSWPDSKTGGMSKPLSEGAVRLLETAPRLEASPYVCPSVFNSDLPMPKHTYYKGWSRILARAGVAHVGTRGIRHRSATDIANSGIPVKVGMALTGHKTVTMFMRCVHTEDEAVREAANAVAFRRLALLRGAMEGDVPKLASTTLEPVEEPTTPGGMPTDLKNRNRSPALANFRPFRHRKGPNRAIPPGTKRAAQGAASR